MNPIGIITSLFGLFSKTDTGAKVGNVVSVAAILAALAPVVLWFTNHSNDVFIKMELTYGETAVYSGILAVIVAVARGTRAG